MEVAINKTEKRYCNWITITAAIITTLRYSILKTTFQFGEF